MVKKSCHFDIQRSSNNRKCDSRRRTRSLKTELIANLRSDTAMGMCGWQRTNHDESWPLETGRWWGDQRKNGRDNQGLSIYIDTWYIIGQTEWRKRFRDGGSSFPNVLNEFCFVMEWLATINLLKWKSRGFFQIGRAKNFRKLLVSTFWTHLLLLHFLDQWFAPRNAAPIQDFTRFIHFHLNQHILVKHSRFKSTWSRYTQLELSLDFAGIITVSHISWRPRVRWWRRWDHEAEGNDTSLPISASPRCRRRLPNCRPS
jgi:hypothetical protein